MKRRTGRAIVVLVIALMTVVALPLSGAARAAGNGPGTTGFTGKVLTNPLLLHNPVTGASAQMMPTTDWLAQHNQQFKATSSGAGVPALPAPTCTLATDNSAGDAHVVVNNSVAQFDSLDLSAFGLSSDSSTVTGQMSVQSLSNGSPAGTPAVPQVAGGGDIWYIVWNYGTNPSVKGYFLEAEYPGSPADPGYKNDSSTGGLPVDFTWGTIVTSPTGGQQFTSGGAADGGFDVANNRITVSAPLSNLGAAHAGDTLGAPYAQSTALVGTSVSGGLLETADKQSSSDTDYHVGNAGATCPTPKQAATSSGTLPTAGSTSNLAYYGGPVVHSIHNYLVWWLPQAATTTYSNGSSCTEPGTVSYSYEQPASGTAPVGALPGGPGGDTDYKAIIQQYFNDLNGSAFYNLLTQYADEETGATINSETLAGTWTDNCGYTSTVGSTTVPGGTEAAPIYQTDIQAEVQRAIAINHWPTGLGNEYYVYTGYGASDCFAPETATPGSAPTCSVAGPVPGYCAYHGDFQMPSGNYVLYADMADGAFAANPGGVNLCYTAPIGVSDPAHTVNNTSVTDPIADAEVSITSHEQFETVNDSEVGTAQQLAPPLGWYDAANGEIGDKCAYNYGNYATDGSNIVLSGHHYIVQQEYSNWNNGCGLTAYQGNGGYGGASDAVTIQQGTTIISVPVAGITNAKQLVASLTAPGQLPAKSITQVQVFRSGKLVSYIPGQTKIPFTLHRTDGVIVTSKVAGTWTPSGSVYTTAPPAITLQPGWNLVAATWPNPGLMTDSIYNQVAAENNACGATILTNAACSPTISDIYSVGAGGKTIDWKPSAADSAGNATWPQTYGNQIPFTSGMWIYAARQLTWTIQGNECQTVDAGGMCH